MFMAAFKYAHIKIKKRRKGGRGKNNDNGNALSVYSTGGDEWVEEKRKRCRKRMM